MARCIKFLIPLLFSAFGLAVWVTWPTWISGLVFVILFFTGSSIGTHVFNSLATPEQIRHDLQHRKQFGS